MVQIILAIGFLMIGVFLIAGFSDSQIFDWLPALIGG